MKLGARQIGARVALVGVITASLVSACGRSSGPSPSASAHPEPTSSNPPQRALPPAGPAELALLAPLVVGEEIETWKLTELSAVDEGSIHLIFSAPKGRAKIEILVTLAEDKGPAPPIVVGRYALFYSVKRVMQSEGDTLARAVAKRLEKNKDLPPPPGLAPYHPVDKKADPL
ncbi:MAG: hypothetical protein ABI193_16320 [Minicystis sp.]